MSTLYQLKERAIPGMEVGSPVAMAAEIAALIGAQAFVVDMVSNTAKFSAIDGLPDVEVKTGDVISMVAGNILVMPKAKFYQLFEDYTSPDP